MEVGGIQPASDRRQLHRRWVVAIAVNGLEDGESRPLWSTTIDLGRPRPRLVEAIHC